MREIDGWKGGVKSSVVFQCQLVCVGGVRRSGLGGVIDYDCDVVVGQSKALREVGLSSGVYEIESICGLE